MAVIKSELIFPRDIPFCYNFAIYGHCDANQKGICIYAHDCPCNGACSSHHAKSLEGLTYVKSYKNLEKSNLQACPKHNTELFMRTCFQYKLEQHEIYKRMHPLGKLTNGLEHVTLQQSTERLKKILEAIPKPVLVPPTHINTDKEQKFLNMLRKNLQKDDKNVVKYVQCLMASLPHTSYVKYLAGQF